jgi:hypothetical protein
MIGWLIDRYSDFREWLPAWRARRHDAAMLRVRERIGDAPVLASTNKYWNAAPPDGFTRDDMMRTMEKFHDFFDRAPEAELPPIVAPSLFLDGVPIYHDEPLDISAALTFINPDIVLMRDAAEAQYERIERFLNPEVAPESETMPAVLWADPHRNEPWADSLRDEYQAIDKMKAMG